MKVRANSIIAVTRYVNAGNFARAVKARSHVAIRLLECVLRDLDLEVEVTFQDDCTGFITSRTCRIADLPTVVQELLQELEEFARSERLQEGDKYTQCSVHAWLPEHALTLVLHSLEVFREDYRDVEAHIKGRLVDLDLAELIDAVEGDIVNMFVGIEDATVPTLRIAACYYSVGELSREPPR